MRGDHGKQIFPLWPAREYAEEACAGEWQEYEAAEIELGALVGELLPKLAAENVLPGVFPTRSDRPVTPSVDQLLAAISAEKEWYGE